MHAAETEMGRVLDEDLEAFNSLLRERGIGPVITEIH